jgi:hypothetical protein
MHLLFRQPFECMGQIWTAVAERSGDTALEERVVNGCSFFVRKRRGASLPAARRRRVDAGSLRVQWRKRSIVTGDDNDVEMDGGPVKDGDMDSCANRLHHLKSKHVPILATRFL